MSVYYEEIRKEKSFAVTIPADLIVPRKGEIRQ